MKSKQGCALVSFLLITRQSHSRESLAALLWDGPSTADTLRFLRKLLYRLGPLLPGLQVSRHRVAYRVHERVAIDFYAVQAALAGSSIETLDQALELYKGDLLAGFHLPEATGFNEWLVVERERLRQSLGVGFRTLCDFYSDQMAWHKGLSAATRWLALDPLDEEVQRRLMEFLAGGGQVAAALRQYESLRSLLWNELEVTPEQATVDLAERLGQLKPARLLQIEQADDTDAQIELPEPGTLPVPGIVPARSVLPYHYNALFVGRSIELLWLAERLLPERAGSRRPVQAVAVTGMGGLGKTQLAVEYAYRYGRYYPGGVYWVGFADGDSVPEGIAALGGERGMRLYRVGEPLTLDERVARVQATWQEPIPRLLIFDNCEDVGLAMQWLPVSGGCSVLMTSRRSEWAPGLPFAVLSLAPLSRAESVAFLEQVIGQIGAEDADLIAQEVGDLPLALHLAAQFLAQRPSSSPRAYLAQLQAGRVLQHMSFRASSGQYSPTGHETDVERMFMLSFRQLRADDEVDALAMRLLTNAACFAPAEPIPQSLLLASAGVDADDVMQLFAADSGLIRLANLGLVDRKGDESVSMHRLIVAFARELLSEDGDALARTEEAVAFAIVTSVLPALARSPYQIALPCSTVHLRYILSSGRGTESRWFVLLAAALGQHLDMIALYEEAQQILEQAIQDAAALADLHAIGVVEFLLARTLANRGFEANSLAHIERAEAALHDVEGDGELQLADLLSEKGWILSRLGNVDAAVVAAEKAYEVSRESDSISGMVEALNLLGVLHYYMLDEYALGAVYLEQALELLDGNGLSQGRASLLANLGENARLQGRFAQAMVLHEAALHESRLAGNRTQVFMHQNNLHGTQAEAGMFREAVAGLENLIEQVPSDWRVIAEAYRYLCEAYLGANKLRPALETAQLSLLHAESSGNVRDLAGALHVMGRVAARSRGFVAKAHGSDATLSAAECFAESVARYSELKLRREVAITLWRWAEFELAEGQQARAETMVQRARELFAELALPLWTTYMEASLAATGKPDSQSLSSPTLD